MSTLMALGLFVIIGFMGAAGPAFAAPPSLCEASWDVEKLVTKRAPNLRSSKEAIGKALVKNAEDNVQSLNRKRKAYCENKAAYRPTIGQLEGNDCSLRRKFVSGMNQSINYYADLAPLLKKMSKELERHMADKQRIINRTLEETRKKVIGLSPAESKELDYLYKINENPRDPSKNSLVSGLNQSIRAESADISVKCAELIKNRESVKSSMKDCVMDMKDAVCP